MLVFGATLTYVTCFVVACSPLTRPRSSGTLSPQGKGCGSTEGIGTPSSNPLPWRERVARSRRFREPGRAG